MYNYTLSQLAGFATLALMVSSYFFKSKKMYLLFQILGLCAMFLSYLFGAEFFAMVALAVSLARTVTFFVYESKDKEAPVAFSFLFAFLTVSAYFTVNLLILKTAKPLDILYLAVQVMYAFVFRIRNIKLMRYIILVPNALAVLYNLLLGGMVFVAVSYLFELLADLYAIIKYNLKPIKER